MAKRTKKTVASDSGSLTFYIFLAIVLAIASALFFPKFAVSLSAGGEIFLRLLKMVVVPLVVTSVMCGIFGMGDVRKLGKPGAYTLLYFLLTAFTAVIIGIILVNVIKPGVGAFDAAALDTIRQAPETTQFMQRTGPGEKDIFTILNNLLLMLFTDNLFKSAVNMELLPLIFFSMVFAGLLTTLGKKVELLRDFVGQANEALMAFILLLMKVAPIGIFCLVAARFGKAQASGTFITVLKQTGWYSFTVVAGLAIHAIIVLPLVYWLFTKKNPYVFIYNMSQALLTAFSTASSTATLPVSIESAQVNAGVSKESTDFVLPLGATINMDGTALYEAAAAIFIAQSIGMHLDLMQQMIVAVTATLAAIGAAGIPEAGLVTMIIVLNAVGLPVEFIGLILSVDWLLDRFRTAVNVFGDCVGAAVVEKSILEAKRG
ncbi:MAG: dicarboxylate/amino acid:cation symporter [Bdellovibrionales bacterium]|nr:dicarboxylate/amino acid:cation symporter [Bdellovibrionales bacterium]